MPVKGSKLLTVHRWCPPGLQDEMELGYVQAPHKTFPVVFDSPRNGELQNFPYERVLVSGRGHSWACGPRVSAPRARRKPCSSGMGVGLPGKIQERPGKAERQLNHENCFSISMSQILHGMY